MADLIKKFLGTPEKRASLMLLAGIMSFAAALLVAVTVLLYWQEAGLVMGRSLIVVVVVAALGIVLAMAAGIWSLSAINRFEGSNALKCTVGYLLDAGALAVIGAFLLIIRSFWISPGG